MRRVFILIAVFVVLIAVFMFAQRMIERQRIERDLAEDGEVIEEPAPPPLNAVHAPARPGPASGSATAPVQ
jgi:hypothetical protein